MTVLAQISSPAAASLDVSGVLGPLLLAAAVAVLVRAVVLLGRVDVRLGRLEDAAHRLGRGDERAAAGGAPPAVDLGRVEGLLEDLRDVQRRLDDRLSALAERASTASQAAATAAAAGAAPAGAPAPTGGALLVERALNRLLALGYEQIEVVTPRDAIEGDGEVVVEARRAGAVHKGHVRFAAGAVVDVALRPSYELFP